LSRGLGTPMRGIDGAAAMNGGKTVTLKNWKKPVFYKDDIVKSTHIKLTFFE
jgi:hypothetical protein